LRGKFVYMGSNEKDEKPAQQNEAERDEAAKRPEGDQPPEPAPPPEEGTTPPHGDPLGG
jgi:hypothetical protein